MVQRNVLSRKETTTYQSARFTCFDKAALLNVLLSKAVSL